MPSIAKQPPIVKTSAYLTTVPFNSRLYLAEAELISNDVLSPDTDKPVLGAKTVYKLTGDGIHTPSFSGFQRNQGSSDYDKQEGVINIITFTYDGEYFWYSITAYATLDAPPYAVGDYGLDDSVIVAATHNVVAALYLEDLTPTGYVSVFDLLSSVHYKGIGQLHYYIRFNGDIEWISSPNAKDAKLVVDCADLGAWVVEVMVGDGFLMSEVVTATCTFQDPNNLCS